MFYISDSESDLKESTICLGSEFLGELLGAIDALALAT